MTRASAKLSNGVIFPRLRPGILAVEGDTDSFILRIWREAVDSTGNVIAWKGSIEHVGSEQYLYFQDLDVMARFVEEQCRLPSGRIDHSGPDGWRGTPERPMHP